MAALLIKARDKDQVDKLLFGDYSKINEEHNYCVMRERQQELKACIANGVRVQFMIGDDIQKYTLYEDMTYGKNYESFRCLVRSLVADFRDDDSIQTNQREIFNWPYYLGGLVKRMLITVNKDPKKEAISIFQKQCGRIFAKTIDKHQSYITGSKDPFSREYIAEQLNHIISEVIDIEQEYRVFVINKLIVGISTYKDYEIDPIPKEIVDYADKLVARIPYANYCMDLCTIRDGGIDIVEFNNIEISGRYIGISADEFAKAIKGA